MEDNQSQTKTTLNLIFFLTCIVHHYISITSIIDTTDNTALDALILELNGRFVPVMRWREDCAFSRNTLQTQQGENSSGKNITRQQLLAQLDGARSGVLTCDYPEGSALTTLLATPASN